MQKTAVIYALGIFLSIFLCFNSASAAPGADEKLTVNILCPADTTNEISIEAKNRTESIASPLPVAPALFQECILKACDTIQKKIRIKVTPLPKSLMKTFVAGHKINIAIPAEDGCPFLLSFDWILLKREDGSLFSGPVIPAGGYENTVTNKIVFLSEKEIGVRQKSSSLGDITYTNYNYRRSSDKWLEEELSSSAE